MSQQIEALKLALEALEAHADIGIKSDKAITAIKEALAQPEQEPFGYFRYDLRLDAWVLNRAGITGTPFYTTPPQRKPLTDEEIDAIIQKLDPLFLDTPTGFEIEFARAIEAAHGIKE